MSIDTTVKTIGGEPGPDFGAADMSTSYTADTIGVEKAEKYPIFRSCLFAFIALAGLAAATVVIIQLNKEPEVQRRPFTPLAVMADSARLDNVALTVRTQGEARPRVEIDLVPQVGGKVVYVSPNFVEGGIFRRGEVLVRVDPADAQVGVTRAEAALAQAQQQLTREIAEGEIARADYEELGRAGTPSPLALRVPQRQQAEAAVKAAEADLGAARLQLDRTRTLAPFDGRVRSKSTDLGQFVSPGTRLGRIFSTDTIEVRIPFTDADLAKIDLPIAYVAPRREDGPEVTLSTTIGGQLQQWKANIVRTDAAYDTQSRALFAIAEVADPYGSGASDNGVPIAPGLFVDADVQGKRFESVVVIPRDGLRVDNEVFVVDDKGQADIRNVSVIDTDPNRAVLSGGIRAGELVVLSPMERSRLSIPLEVRDINNPSEILVKPEPPEWAKKAEENASEKKKRRGFFGRGKDDSADTTSSDDDTDDTEDNDTE